MFNANGVKKKIKITCGFFIAVILLLIIRLYYIQVHPAKVVQGELKNYQMETTAQMRFKVLDMDGNDMIQYDNKYVLVIDTQPFKLNNYEETLEDLLALNFIMKSEDSSFNYTDIIQGSGKVYYEITEETYHKIEKLTNIKGIYTYAYKSPDLKEGWKIENFIASIDQNKDSKIGDFQKQVNEYIKDNVYDTNNYYLDDKSVYSIVEVNDKSSNKNIRLTINSDWTQKIREVLASEDYSFLKNVGVVLIESDTGKIRAMVQKDESQANVNLCIGSIGYEPGSIFKILTEAISLDLGITNADDVYYCEGAICTKKGESYAHGALTVEQALEVSCNDIFAQLGNKAGYGNMLSYTEKLGLYKQVLGIDGKNKEEASGVKITEDEGVSNFSIGQCITVTPLQIAGAINAVVNDGVYIKPSLIDAVVDNDNNEIIKDENEEVRVFSSTTSEIVQNTMNKVIWQGTGYEAKVDGVEEGGKTGTSTGEGGATNHGWFAGYFSLGGRKYTMVIVAPNIGDTHPDGRELGGGNTGAPIFRDIINALKN